MKFIKIPTKHSLTYYVDLTKIRLICEHVDAADGMRELYLDFAENDGIVIDERTDTYDYDTEKAKILAAIGCAEV